MTNFIKEFMPTIISLVALSIWVFMNALYLQVCSFLERRQSQFVYELRTLIFSLSVLNSSSLKQSQGQQKSSLELQGRMTASADWLYQLPTLASILWVWSQTKRVSLYDGLEGSFTYSLTACQVFWYFRTNCAIYYLTEGASIKSLPLGLLQSRYSTYYSFITLQIVRKYS